MIRLFLFFFIFITFISACRNIKKDQLLEQFVLKVKALNFRIDSIKSNDDIYLSKDSLQYRVNLKKLRDLYSIAKFEKTIEDYIVQILQVNKGLPVWNIAKENVFAFLSPSNFSFNNVLNEKVSKNLSKIYIYSSNSNLVWLTTEDLKIWGIEKKELELQSSKNERKIFGSLNLELDTLLGHKYISFQTNRPSFNSTIILSKQLKEIVSNQLEWPVYAITPCRDQCYLFGANDLEFIKSKLKNFIYSKYSDSNDPLSLEILEISDSGIKNIYQF